MPNPFQDQHAIITGGSSGIGKATACLLAAGGAHISIISRHPEKLAAAKAEIEKVRASATQRVFSVPADVSIRAQAERATNAAIAEMGPPAIVVTSAGMVQPGLFRDLPIESFEDTVTLNYLGTIYVVKTALPSMIAQGRGHIVMISSGAGLIGVYGYTSYSPTKFALHGLAQALRAELKPTGVHVSVVYPSDTDTPQLAEENRTKPPETWKINGTVKPQSPGVVARAIVHGIRANRFDISSNMEMGLLKRLSSLIEPAMNWYMDSMVESVRREKVRSKG